MMADIIEIDTARSFAEAVDRASQLLKMGEIVGVPTETVYGLAANALEPKAVERIFSAKGRPATNPLIVHINGEAMARRCVSAWPDPARLLCESFWPGPLTIVLPRSDAIPDIVTAGGNTVAIRWPSHPFMNALLKACDFPLAAPSANRSGAISSTNAAHVQKGLGDKIKLIVDGGQSQFGIESTVVDLAVDPPRILRPGMITSEMLKQVLGREVAAGPAERDGVSRSPGLMEKHYAPQAKVLIWNWENEEELRGKLRECGIPQQNCQIISHTRVPLHGVYRLVSVIPEDPEAFGRALYGELHRGDESGVKFIILEELPDQPEWAAIRDRLQRASA